jgi:hypothetical protein
MIVVTIMAKIRDTERIAWSVFIEAADREKFATIVCQRFVLRMMDF